MSESFSPRTVIVVALASLVGGFVAVFGGGMALLRSQRSTDDDAGVVEAPDSRQRDTLATTATRDGGEPGTTEDLDASTATAGVTLSPLIVSRCFAGMAPTAIPGARCGTLPALDQYLRSRAVQIAACANGSHGTLTFVMDFRFSTQHVGAWGGPSSTIPNAGPVSLCVRRATAPLPLATIAHNYDRYIVSVPIEW